MYHHVFGNLPWTMKPTKHFSTREITSNLLGNRTVCVKSSVTSTTSGLILLVATTLSPVSVSIYSA